MLRPLLSLQLLALAACHPDPAHTGLDALSEGLAAGDMVTVQLRRDHLGAAAPNGISPISGSHNGAAVSLPGELIAVTPDWIVMTNDGVERWVARESVLLVTVRRQ